MRTVYSLVLACTIAMAGCTTTSISNEQLAKSFGATEFWRADFSLARGNTTWCTGSFGTGVAVKEQKLYILFSRTDYALSMPLNADGSAQGDVMIDWRNPSAGKEMVRLTVPAGTAPRELELLTLRSNCTYRVIPRAST